VPGPPDAGRRPLSVAERAYLERRLRQLESTAAELERLAADPSDPDAEDRLLRAAKHRSRAGRIREYLRQ